MQNYIASEFYFLALSNFYTILHQIVSDNIPDTLSDKVRDLESKIEQITSDTLSDIQADTDIDEKIEKAIDYAMSKAIAILKSDEEFLRAIAGSILMNWLRVLFLEKICLKAFI